MQSHPELEELKKEYNEFLLAIDKNQEGVSLELLNDILKKYGETNFLKLYETGEITISLNGLGKITPLAFSALRSMPNLLKKLIDLLKLKNPLELDIGFTKIPLDNIQNETDPARLTKKISYEIVKYAGENDKLSYLLKNPNNAMAFILEATMEIYPNYFNQWEKTPENKNALMVFVDSVRRAYFNFPKMYKEFDQTCLNLKEILQQYNAIKIYQNYNPPPSSIKEAYRNLKLEGQYDPNPLTKEQALNNVVANIYFILNTSLDSSLAALKELDNKLADKIEERKRLGKKGVNLLLDPNSYKLISLDNPDNNLKFPIPTENYKKEKKESILKEVLIEKFQQYGLAKKLTKWAGFVPPKLANPTLQEGDYVTESRKGLGLFHNKVSHDLQRYIFMACMEHGLIDINYGPNQENKLTIKEILAKFLEKDKDGNYLWTPVFDTHNSFIRTNFSSPHHLASFIMSEGKKHGLNILPDIMIDSACKGILELREDINKELPEESQLTAEELINKFNDLYLRTFSQPHHLLEKEIEKAKKAWHEIETNNHNYVVITKPSPYPPYKDPIKELNSKNARFFPPIEHNKFDEFDSHDLYEKIRVTTNETEIRLILESAAARENGKEIIEQILRALRRSEKIEHYQNMANSILNLAMEEQKNRKKTTEEIKKEAKEETKSIPLRIKDVFRSILKK